MNQPQYPPQAPYQQPYPQQPGYPPAQPAYYQPQPAYAPPQPAYYQPQQGYAQAPPPPPVVRGSIAGYYGQPSVTGGKSVADFLHRQPGQSLTGIVARPITDSDFQQQTDIITKVGKFWRDGSPKLDMVVPLTVQPSQDFPEGKARIYIKPGLDRDNLGAAMRQAGADPSQPPEAGAQITITWAGDLPPRRAGQNPQHVHEFIYRSPSANGHAPQPPAQVQQYQQAPQVPQQQYQQVPAQPGPYPQQPYPQPAPQMPPGPAAPQQYQPPVSQPQYPPAQQYAPQPGYAPAQPGQQVPQQPPAPQPPVQPAPADLNPQQQEILARLAAQQQPASQG